MDSMKQYCVLQRHSDVYEALSLFIVYREERQDAPSLEGQFQTNDHWQEAQEDSNQGNIRPIQGIQVKARACTVEFWAAEVHAPEYCVATAI